MKQLWAERVASIRKFVYKAKLRSIYQCLHRAQSAVTSAYLFIYVCYRRIDAWVYILWADLKSESPSCCDTSRKKIDRAVVGLRLLLFEVECICYWIREIFVTVGLECRAINELTQLEEVQSSARSELVYFQLFDKRGESVKKHYSIYSRSFFISRKKLMKRYNSRRQNARDA